MIRNNIYAQAPFGTIPDTNAVPSAPPETELTAETAAKLKDPFDNPTEYHNFRDDYSKILPWIKMPDYKIPLTPARAEKNMLKRQYSIAGVCMLLHFLSSQIGITVVMFIIEKLIALISGNDNSAIINDYMTQSSILSALNMITFVLANSIFAMIGLRWSKTKTPSLFITRNFNIQYAVEYCVIGLGLWTIATYTSAGIENIINQFGYSTIPAGMDESTVTGLGMAIDAVYSCIMAPVTEEIFFRGMMLRVISKANQRFAVVATAVFFGLTHGNIPQFVLAFLLGLFLAHITLKHDSIIPAIIVHMFLNTFVTVTSYLPESTIIEGILNMILVASLLVGAVLLVIYRRTDRIPSTTPAQARRGIAVAKTSPAFVAPAVLMAFFMVVMILLN